MYNYHFWSRVGISAPDECWEWLLCKMKGGYGRYKIGKKEFTAHRIAWELFYGPVPQGKELHHACCNPACVNPMHLLCLTPREHTLLERSGERSKLSKLSEEDVRLIRFAYASGRFSRRDLAVCLAVSESLIEKVVYRKVWKHVLASYPL